jgi:hypothetical protein
MMDVFPFEGVTEKREAVSVFLASASLSGNGVHEMAKPPSLDLSTAIGKLMHTSTNSSVNSSASVKSVLAAAGPAAGGLTGHGLDAALIPCSDLVCQLMSRRLSVAHDLSDLGSA